MDSKQQMLCAWAGPAFVILFCIGIWFVAGFVPPHLPTATATEIAAFYQSDPSRIRIGLVITMFAATTWIPWAAALSAQMKRMNNYVLADGTVRSRSGCRCAFMASGIRLCS